MYTPAPDRISEAPTIAETDAAGTVKAWYVSAGLNAPLARIGADGIVRYFHADILGSVVALTDATGAVTTRYSYTPFGAMNVEGEQLAQPLDAGPSSSY